MSKVDTELYGSIYNLLVAQGHKETAAALLKDAKMDKKNIPKSDALPEIFTYYKNNNKRAAAGDDKAKKTDAKKVVSSDSSSSESDSSSDSDSEDEKPAAKAAPAKAAPAKKAASSSSSSESDSSDSDSEDEKPAAKAAPVKAAPAAKAAPAKKAASSSSSSSSDSSSSDSDSSDDEKPAAKSVPVKAVPAAKATPAKAAAKKDDSSSSSSSDSSSSDSDSSEDEKPMPPAKKARVEPTPAAATPAAKAAKSAPATPAAAGGVHKVYVKGLPWTASEAEVSEFFVSCGPITSVELPLNEEGRSSGTAYVIFGARAGLDAAIALDGQTWPGTERWLKILESTGGDKKFGNENSVPGERPEGCDTLFVGNMPWDIEESQLYELFGTVGEVSSVRFATSKEDGSFRGFGHVSFANGDDVLEAIKLNGTMLNGRGLRLDFAPPKAPRESFGGGGRGAGGSPGGRGGFGGGRGAGGRGGRGGRGASAAPTAGSKNKGSIAASTGKKMTFD